MTRKDFFLFAFWSAAALALIGRALIEPRWGLANFGDLYAYHYPMRHLVVSALQAGRLPFWNPYIFCGLPLSGNSQAVLFYPGSLLSAVLPLALSFTWDYALHMLWGALGLFLLARRERLSSSAACLLASLYVFCPFVVYRIVEGIPTLLAGLSWVPWCWLALLSKRKGFLAAALALQFLSGHPQFLTVNVLAMAVWAAGRSDRFTWFLRLSVEGLGALALTVAQWIPTGEFAGHSIRLDWPRAFALGYSIDAASLWTWVRPNALGNPLDGTWAGVPSVFFETTGVFIGWAGLAAAAVGLLKGRSRAAALLIALGILLALGGHNPLYRFAVEHGPAGWLRTPSRYALLSLWGLVLAAGAGVSFLERRWRPSAGLKAAFVCAAMAQLLLWDRPFVRGEAAGPFVDPNPKLIARIAGEPLRILTDPELANPNKTMLYRAMNVNGYDAFYLQGYPAFAARSEGAAAADSSRTYLRRYDSPEMKSAGVVYYLGASGNLTESPGALPLAYAVDARGKTSGLAVNLPRPERWRIRGRLPAEVRKIVVSLPQYPGWRAWLNGQAVELEEHDYFVSLKIPYEPRMAHAPVSLDLEFVPSCWALLSGLSAAAWLLLAGLMAGAFATPLAVRL